MTTTQHPRSSSPDPRLALVAANQDFPGDFDRAPQVGGPQRSASLWLSLGLILVVGLGGFLWLNARRTEAAAPLLTAPTAVASAHPPPDLVLPEDPPAPPPAPVSTVQRAPTPLPTFILPASPLAVPAPRPSTTPVLIVDMGAPGEVGRMRPTAGLGQPAGRGESALNDTEAFAQRVGGQDEPDRATATRLRNPGSVVAQGVIIPAILETAIDSDLPGFARAVVSRDILSFDGAAVLIPRGSRLIGQYKSDVTAGQSRVFVLWSRLIRPDGASIQIASPASDPLGRGGLEGRVDRRWGERFGGPALLSTLNAGLNALTRDSASQVVVTSSTGALSQASGGRQISPVIKVAQGAPIRVFVARDLDFSPVGPARAP
jgi:type IV secretory pathway VirB10-like protein